MCGSLILFACLVPLYPVRIWPCPADDTAGTASEYILPVTLNNILVNHHFLDDEWPLLAAIRPENWPEDLSQSLRDAFDAAKDRRRAENDTVYYRTASGDCVPYVAL